MVPDIRLNGFSGDWDNVTIGEVSSSFSGGTPTAGVPAYYGGNIPFIRSGEITKDKTSLYLTEEGLSSSSAKIVKKGTLLYALYGATSGEVGISKLDGAINQAVLAIIPHSGINSEYLAHYLRAKKDKIVATLLQGGQGNLSGALIKGVKVSIPRLFEEQQNIASFFHLLDTFILLTAKKADSLKQLKIASLQSMFPQEGESVPQVRFGNRTTPWEEFNLGTLLTERHDVSTITPNLPQLSFTIAEGIIRPEDRKSNQRDFLIKDKDNKRYLVTRVGDIIYNPANVVYGAIHRNSLIDGVVSPIYRIFSSNQDSRFMECVVRRPSFIISLAMRTEGTVTKLKTLKPEAFLDMTVSIPTDLEEQRMIGEYFKNLDAQISFQSQRLEKLKQIKSACLDNMFV